MISVKKILLFFVITMMSFSMLISCATTGDPRQGGLFGWSSAKAQQRIEDRQRRLDQVTADNRRLQSESVSLQRQYGQVQQQRIDYSARLNSINAQLASIEAQNRRLNKKSAQYNRIQNEIAQTKAKLAEARRNQSTSNQEQQRIIEQLDQDISKLQYIMSLS